MEPMPLSAWPRDGRATLLAATLGIGMGVAAVVSGARAAGWLQGLELAAYDRFLRARAAMAPSSERVVVVRIREVDIARHGHPLPDAVLVRCLDAIAAAGPRAIGVDLYRTPPRGGGDEAAWRALAARFRDDDRMVLIEKLPQRGDPGVAPPPFAEGSGRVGFSDIVIDSDGVVRRGLLFLWPQPDRPELSFALQLALTFLRPDGITLHPAPERPEWVRLGPTTVPAFGSSDGPWVDADAGGYQLALDFAAGDGLATYDLETLLAGRVPAEALRDRVVLLGTDSHSVKDDFVTAASGGERVTGVALHGLASDQLLRMAAGESRPLRFVSDAGELAAIAGFALLGAGVVFLVPNLFGIALAALVALVLAAAAWLASGDGLWVPWVSPGLASLGASGLVLAEYGRRERAERRAMMDLFGRYVSRTVAEDLWRHRDEFMDGGRPRPQRLTVTAMLTDLKGYTRAAEILDAEVLMDWVNEYMDVMTQVVERHGGIVDDYTGDGIKANFGAPRVDPVQIAQDARSAVRCAITMGEELQKLAGSWRQRGLPVVPMRVGIFTGTAVGGSLGSADRMKYTTVGNTINTAARLESLHKEDFEPSGEGDGPLARILIGEPTRQHLGDEFDLEDLGDHELRGRAEPVRVYRVRGLAHGEKEET